MSAFPRTRLFQSHSAPDGAAGGGGGGGGAPATDLDLYLDGLLPGDRAAAFERALAADPALAEQVRVQRGIDAGLREGLRYEQRPALRLAGGGASANRTEMRPASQAMGRGHGEWKRQVWAVAALVVLAAGVIWMNLTPSGVPRANNPILDIAPDAAFSNLLSSGFKPQFVCTTDEAFAKAVRERFGQALLVAATPSVELLGWAYDAGYRTRVLGNESLILMARSDGHEVIVLMDTLASDRPLAAPTAPGVHLHRRVVGQMVVYEVSRSATPLVADKVYDPDAKK